MNITVVAFRDCMTSAVFGLLDALTIAGAMAARSNASRWAGHRVRLATDGGGPVEGFGGFRIDPHCSLHDAADSDVVLVPPILGGIEEVLAREAGVIGWLAGLGADTALLASTCTGAFLLAEAGVLRGRRITTNPAFAPLFGARYPDVGLALDQRIADDGRVICAGSTTAFLDLAVHLVDRLGGHDLAVATAKALSLDKNPGSQRPYLLFIAPRDHGDARVLQLQDWIEARFADPVTIADMVDAFGMSPRNLNRRFQAATGLSPMEYLRHVRIETAKRLLELDGRSVDRVAEQVGYGDTRAFIRSFGTLAGLSPGEYRRRFRAR